jgi:hypothetical protein
MCGVGANSLPELTNGTPTSQRRKTKLNLAFMASLADKEEGGENSKRQKKTFLFHEFNIFAHSHLKQKTEH